MNRAIAVFLAGALIALAGCTAWFGPVPAPTASISPSSTGSADEAAPDPGRPGPRIDIDCGDLVGVYDLGQHLSGAVLQEGGAARQGAPSMSDEFVIAQARGITCDWAAPGGRGALHIALLFNARPLWNDIARVSEREADPLLRCNSYHYWDHEAAEASACSFEGPAGAHWVELRATDIDMGVWASDEELTDAVTPILTRILDVIRQARPNNPATQPSPRPLPHDCEQILPVAEVNDIGTFGTHEAYSDGIEFTQRVGSIAGAASWVAGAPFCGLVGRTRYPLYLEILPGGAWALHETLDDPALDPAIPVVLEGLLPGDGAWSRCGASLCEFNLDLGGNWVQLSVSSWEETMTEDQQRVLLAGLTTAATIAVEQVG
jgi:hypothetical protein